MEQGTTWTRFLLIGISIIAFSCSKGTTEYRVRSDWVYVNKTEYTIEYGDPNTLPILNPNESYTFYQEGGGPPNVTEYNYVVPDRLSSIIRFDNDWCDTLYVGENAWGDNAESIFSVDNYSSEKIEDNYFRFTYTFTNKDYDLAGLCE